MGTPAIGFLGYWQGGREATFNTPVAATTRFDAASMSVEPVIGEIPDESLNGQLSAPASVQGGIFYRATVKTRFDYTGQLMLLDSLFGTATFGSNGGVTTGANPYAHVYTEKSILNSHSFEFVEGRTGKATRLYGAKVVGFKVDVKAGVGEAAKAMVEWKILAKSLSTDFTPTGALSAPTPNPLLFHEISTMDDGTADIAADIRVRSLSISMDSKAAEDRFYMGSVNFDEPIRDGFLEVKWNMTKEYQTKVLLDAAIAYTSGSPKVVFGSSTSKRVTLESGTAKLMNYGNPVSGPGIVEQSFEWKAFYNATDLGALKVTVEDAVSAIAW